MQILEILDNLYTNKKADWFKSIEDTLIQPFVIQRWLCMNDMLRVQVRWLDKYVFTLPPKMYLSLAWSIIPKVPKMPFNKYIKQSEEDTELDFIIVAIRKHFKMSDNDWNANSERILKEVRNNMPTWFKYYGIQKRYWKKYHLNFEEMRKDDNPKPSPQKGLGAWGI